LAAGLDVNLGAKTTSFRGWAERLQSYSRTEELRTQASYWAGEDWRRPIRIPRDYNGANTVQSLRRVTVWLTQEETDALLKVAPEAYHTQVNEVLMTALAQAMSGWLGEDILEVELEGHGREDIFEGVDLTRTVGWFTSMFPVRLRLCRDGITAQLKEVKEQLRRVPGRGIGYGIATWMSESEDLPSRRPDISFNYLGQFDQVFRESQMFAPSADGTGPNRAHLNERGNLLEVSGMVVNGRIRLECGYSENIHKPETIERLADAFADSLRRLIAECGDAETAGRTPSDYPEAQLTQAQLDELIRRASPSGGSNIQAIYPLSQMQQGLLFHSLYSPGSGAYFLQMSCLIRGGLDVEAFKSAWQAVADRHSILRTSFQWEGAREPLQVVQTHVKLVWEELDWRGEAQAAERIKLYLGRDRQKGFDLGHAPVVRLALLRAADDGYYFVWSSHHILLDGWSTHLMMQEVFKLYGDFRTGKKMELTQSPPHIEYIKWLKKQDLGTAETFWREELKGFRKPTRICAEAEVGLSDEDQLAEETMRLDPETTDGLERLAKSAQVTLNTIAKGSWGLVLSRYTNNPDVLFGTTMSGRSAPVGGIESMLGLFINTLPVRVQVHEDQTVRDYLKKLHAKQTTALAHEYCPLIQIQEWSELPSGKKLFESLFTFQNYPADAGIRRQSDSGLRISEVRNFSKSNYPLVVLAIPGKKLLLKAIYDPSRLDRSGVVRLLEDMRQVLRGMSAGRESRIAEVGLATDIERKDTVEGFRLSPQQRRLWRLQDGAGLLWSECTTEIRGIIDGEAIRRSAGETLRKWGVLRTVFQRRPGLKVPVQVIDDDAHYSWEYVDLRQCVEPERIKALNGVSQLSAGCEEQQTEARIRLLRFEDKRAVLSLSFPSIIADGHSAALLAREILDRSDSGALRAADPPDCIEYIQFAEWQNETLRSEDPEAVRGRTYWGEIEQANLSVTLPQERRLREKTVFAPELVQNIVDDGLRGDIEGVAKRLGFGEAEVLGACWAILISRLSADREALIWNLTDGRGFEDLRQAIGPYARAVPTCLRIEETAAFRGALSEWRDRLQKNSEFQDYYDSDRKAPASLADECGIAFEYLDSERFHTAGAANCELIRLDSWTDRFKLKMSCFRSGECLKAEIWFDPNVYHRDTAEQIAIRFKTLVESVAGDPEAAVGELNILSDVEKHLALVELNDSSQSYPQALLIHEMFQEQAAQIPDSVAVVFEDSALTYGQLEHRANQLANYLCSLGVALDSLVGLYMERSCDLLVGILGIIKSGAAYLPIDPSNPTKRLAMILEDSGVRVIVTTASLVERLASHDANSICLDGDQYLISAQPHTAPNRAISCENLAYAIFTSGSTGRPKGVGIEHRQLLNYVQGVRERLDLPSRANYATVSTFAADLGHTVIFPALIGGGSLSIISFERATDPVALGEYFAANGMDCLKIVPSHFAALVASPNPAPLMPRRRLILGGEASRAGWVEELRRLAPDCAIFNHYGPTETTVGVLTYPVAGSACDGDGAPATPLGRPIPNSRALILDPQMRPLPLGGSGEIWIGGENVGRGYINRPDLTADRFMPDPLAVDGGRVYRTGDLARHLRSGDIEFLGRADEQVKFHGHRLELNEIRGALNRYPTIRDSIVRVCSEDSGNQVIVAYYVSSEQIEPAELRAFLAESIVEETLPNIYIHLKRPPLTINGKIDYSALPGIDEARKQMKRGQTQPRTATEEVIAGVWCQVLRLSRVGVEDNFLEIGGHSLLATQVISRVRELFRVDVPLRALFENPTVAGLAAAVEKNRGADRAEAPPIRRIARDRDLPTSFAQQRLWFVHQMDPRSPAYTIPYAVRLTGPLELPSLRRSFQAVTARHEVLRTRIESRNGAPVQVIDEPKDFELAVWDLSTVREADREEAARQIAGTEALRPFDLERGPLCRASLLKLAAEDHVLLLCMHHMVSDAWSIGVLVKELTTLYEGYREGRTPTLPDLPLQYADYSVWQREWLQAETLEQELGYWRRQLAGIRAVEFPTDRTPRDKAPRGEAVPFKITNELTEELKKISRAEGATLFMTLLTAFQMVLAKYAGQDDVVVGTDVANRNRLETEGIIGFFINQLILRTDLSGNPSFRDLLARVRETTLDAYAHQDVPFEKLVEELAPERSLDRSPLFQVRLLLHNAPAQGGGVRSLQLKEFPFKRMAHPKFELSLHLVESSDGLRGNLHYRSDLFAAGSATWLLALFEKLLLKLTQPRSMDVSVNAIMTEVETPLRSEKQQQQYDLFRAAARQGRRREGPVGPPA